MLRIFLYYKLILRILSEDTVEATHPAKADSVIHSDGSPLLRNVTYKQKSGGCPLLDACRSQFVRALSILARGKKRCKI
jgi:hypothetical protein